MELATVTNCFVAISVLISMVNFSPDVLAWKHFLLRKFGGWTEDNLCAFSELFNSLYTCHHQLSAYFSRKYLSHVSPRPRTLIDKCVSSSQNLDVIQQVTSLLSPSKNMQFCNEQIRTPPCASATYGSARMWDERIRNVVANAWVIMGDPFMIYNTT